jgi:hypothetical protein
LDDNNRYYVRKIITISRRVCVRVCVCVRASNVLYTTLRHYTLVTDLRPTVLYISFVHIEFFDCPTVLGLYPYNDHLLSPSPLPPIVTVTITYCECFRLKWHQPHVDASVIFCYLLFLLYYSLLFNTR